MARRIAALLATLAALGCGATLAGDRAPADGSPLDHLPPHIRQVTHFGERADWSHDGRKILFLEKTFGDVYEIELSSGIIRPLTHHYFHEGYTRALYLANGDILLSGAKQFDAENPWESRSGEKAELWLLPKDRSGPAIALGERCSEGPAVSRRSMRIAWTSGGVMFEGTVSSDGKGARIAHRRRILGPDDLPFKTNLETQNFRPANEEELIFSAYGYQATEVMGVNIKTGQVTNYSKAATIYNEPEGIFPDGKYTLMECDAHQPKGSQYIDLYRLALDGSGSAQRLTFFNDYPGWKASNGVVSDDGRFIAFQAAKVGERAGIGHGILVFDIEQFERTGKR